MKPTQPSHQFDEDQSVAILILNWQNWPASSKCLASIARLEQWGRDSLSLVIVDNGSLDDSAQHIQGWLEQQPGEQITFIRNAENLGFSGGNNSALGHVLGMEPRPQFVWLLNNDTQVSSDSLSTLLKSAEIYPDVKVWGSTLLANDGKTVEYGGGGRYIPSLSLQINHYAGKNVSEIGSLSETVGLDFICAASMLVRTDVFAETGLLSDEFFLYYEELDLCMRLDTASEVAWCPKSLLTHDQGASTADSRQGLMTRQFHENLSTFKFTAMHYWYFLLPVLLLRLLIKPVLFAFRGELFLVPVFLRSYSSFFRWLFSRKAPPSTTRP